MPREDTTDKDALVFRVQRHWQALGDAPDHLRADPDVVLMAISQNWKALELAAEPLRSNHEFNTAILRQNGCALQFVVDTLRKDRGIVYTAVREHWAALQYADASLQNDREIVVQAMMQAAIALKYASPELQAQQEELLVEAGYGDSSDPFNEVSKAHDRGPKVQLDDVCVNDIRIQKAKSGMSRGIYVKSMFERPRFKIPALKGLAPSKDSLSIDGKWHSRRINEIKERTVAMQAAQSRSGLSDTTVPL